MPSLSQIQRDFQRFLLEADTTIERHVVGTHRVAVATRLDIYGGGYGARLTEALQANYPVLAELLGEPDFAALAAAYIRGHDSQYASIRYYGDELGEFLGDDPVYSGIPVLAELARWEWAMTETFDAADAPTLPLSAMADISPDEWSAVRFEWHPSVRRLELAWNVPQIWKALSADGGRPEPSLSAEPGQWLLWRRELDIFFRSLTPSETAALDAAGTGGSFGEVCDLLCAFFGEDAAAAQAAAYLREWLQSGLIVGITAG